MTHATTDRGAILHFAGRHGLSPALRAGVPALVREQGEGTVRCGWEPFFAALDRAGPALVTDDAEPSGARPGPGGGHPAPSLGAAWAEARRFLDALRTGHGSPPQG